MILVSFVQSKQAGSPLGAHETNAMPSSSPVKDHGCHGLTGTFNLDKTTQYIVMSRHWR